MVEIARNPAGDQTGPDLSLIICTLNEGTAIRSVINEICDTLAHIHHEIIVVDDNSTDNTAAEVLDVAKSRPNVRLHVRINERGLSSAAIKGWDMAHGKYLGVMDGDGQHDPKAILAMAEIILKGDKDLVCVSRYIGKSETGLSFFRDLGSRAATLATGLVLRVPLTDPMSGCFMMTRDYYMSARKKLTGVGFKILLDVAASSPIQPRFTEVKASLRQRQGGESKLDIRVVLDLAALLVEKATGGVMKARFVLFAGVGMSGVVVSAIVLALFKILFGNSDAEFGIAQFVAIMVSMTSNFFINNAITFRDKRLKGAAMWAGMFGFYLACAPGAVLNWFIGVALKSMHVEFILAGVVPAFLIGILNFWFVKMLAWRAPKPPAT
ncbi:MAG: glycosyltransferase [Asticcacaulis sp.]